MFIIYTIYDIEFQYQNISLSFSVLFPEVDDERSVALQAGFQILGLVVTLFIAIVTGAATGKLCAY